MAQREYDCWHCGNKKTKRKIPYGSKRVQVWCPKCDKDLVNAADKKHARKEGKKEIQRQLDDYEEGN